MNVKTERIRTEIYRTPGVSRKGLREVTGFDSRTIANALEKLQQQGFIRVQREEEKATAGRPGELYYPADDDCFYAAGVYVDIRNILCVIADNRDQVVGMSSEPFSLELASVNHTAHRVDAMVRRMAEQYNVKISAIGLTVRDRREPRFLSLIVRLLTRLVEIPVYSGYPIDAFGWLQRVKHPEPRRIVTVHFHYEIEICWLEQFAIREKGHQLSKELLHIQVDPNGPLCSCGGNGCMENYINEYTMMEEFRYRTGRSPEDQFDFYRCFVTGEPVAGELVAKKEECVQMALRKIVEHCRPDLLVLVILNNDRLNREMKQVITGDWIPAGIRSKMNFQVYDDRGNSGESCLKATAIRAVFQEKMVRLEHQ